MAESNPFQQTHGPLAPTPEKWRSLAGFGEGPPSKSSCQNGDSRTLEIRLGSR